VAKPRFLIYDNLDDRREIHTLMGKLSPQSRIEFVAQCCRDAPLQVSRKNPHIAAKTLELAKTARWDSSADERLTTELYFDLWSLANGFDFDLDIALARLVQMVRKR
jgi:hypothetical protein